MSKGMSYLTRALIWSRGNAWRVAKATDPEDEVREVSVHLDVLGNDVDGYDLVMAPEGCFTADAWYASKMEAIESAARHPPTAT
jgi:hypothetical protein